jgi:Protein of unknown function, DUF600
MTDEIQNLFQHIGQLAFDSVATDEWDVITLKARVTLTFSQLTATYIHHEKQFVPKTFFIEDDDLEYDMQTTPSFQALRRLMYNEAPFRGAWYMAIMTITNAGKFDTEFDYDNKPDFKYESDDEGYAKDFEHFPRNEESTPDWLKEIVRKYGLKYHEPEPLA